jgi:hypothetical protein
MKTRSLLMQKNASDRCQAAQFSHKGGLEFGGEPVLAGHQGDVAFHFRQGEIQRGEEAGLFLHRNLAA